MDISAYLWGVASSITAALVIYLCRNQAANTLNIIFHKVYPKISGRYEILTPKERKATPSQRDILTLHQFGSKIWGLCETIEGTKIICKDKIYGKVTASRIFVFEYQSISDNHHDYGTGLYRIQSNNKEMTGYLSVLCVHCQNATSVKSIIKKIDDES